MMPSDSGRVWDKKRLEYVNKPKPPAVDITAKKDDKNKDRPPKEVKYNASDLITKKDVGRSVVITTVLNTVIRGTLTNTAQYEYEISNGNDKTIVYKSSIVTIKFLDPPKPEVK